MGSLNSLVRGIKNYQGNKSYQVLSQSMEC